MFYRLEPMLHEISRERKIVAMATMDYIDKKTFQYQFNFNYLTRYVWDWSLIFFEGLFRDDQIGDKTTDPRP